jgi:hypothetical protein
MAETEEWAPWIFLGYQSAEEGKPVQTWFDALPEVDRYEIVSTVNYLQSLPICWDEIDEIEEFDSLEGEGGISEIRVPEIRREENGVRKKFAYRIYGVFGPKEGAYTFLHGCAKPKRNDREGKRIAKERLGKLTRREADVHEFNFSEISFQRS